MSTKAPDDLEAVRSIVEALKPFDGSDQERIIRWAREKLGLSSTPARQLGSEVAATLGAQLPLISNDAGLRSRDIRSFVDSKQPQSDNQFAATVAYYYRFEAPEADRKPDITAGDLQDAARRAGRDRFTRPAQTLLNAHGQGYFDKADRGHYALNTVGENLVAMALPQDAASSTRRSAIARKRRNPNRANKRTGRKKK